MCMTWPVLAHPLSQTAHLTSRCASLSGPFPVASVLAPLQFTHAFTPHPHTPPSPWCSPVRVRRHVRDRRQALNGPKHWRRGGLWGSVERRGPSQCHVFRDAQVGLHKSRQWRPGRGGLSPGTVYHASRREGHMDGGGKVPQCCRYALMTHADPTPPHGPHPNPPTPAAHIMIRSDRDRAVQT